MDNANERPRERERVALCLNYKIVEIFFISLEVSNDRKDDDHRSGKEIIYKMNVCP